MRLRILTVTAIIVGFALVSFAIHRVGRPVLAATPSDGITLPPGYRDWSLISVAAFGPPANDVRAKLGNDVAMAAFRQGTIPYPDGSIIARLAWKQTQDPQTVNAFRLQARQAGLSSAALGEFLSQSFVAGSSTNVQLMVKDSKKYGSTGGWRFAQFTNGKSDTVAVQTCFACHAPAKATDFVFTHYAP